MPTVVATSGYLPIEHFQETDDDHSAVRIRDMPYGKPRESLEIYPTEIVFPGSPAGTMSPRYPVMITNNGYDIVNISNIQIVGDFVVYGTIANLTPGQHGFLEVAFTPKRDGVTTGGLYIDTGNAAGLEFVKLIGTGDGGGGFTRSLYYVATTGQRTFLLTTRDRFDHWYSQVPYNLAVSRNGGRLMPVDALGNGGYTRTADKHGIILTWPAGDGEIIVIDI